MWSEYYILTINHCLEDSNLDTYTDIVKTSEVKIAKDNLIFPKTNAQESLNSNEKDLIGYRLNNEDISEWNGTNEKYIDDNSEEINSSNKLCMNGNKTIEIHYPRKKYKLTLEKGNCISTTIGGGEYKQGQMVLIDATVEEKTGYANIFEKWENYSTQEKISEEKQYSFTMGNSNLTLIASAIDRKINGIVPEVLFTNYKDVVTVSDVVAASDVETIPSAEVFIPSGGTNGISYYARIYNIYDGGAGDDDGEENNVITISKNKIYGTTDDVGTKSTYAKRMVVVKYNGNTEIEEGVTITAINNGYGGPKGMYICCTGTLTNNGTITMTAKGAKAEGENVYLYSVGDSWDEGEYVPASGADGGGSVEVYITGTVSGKQGANGKLRSTGGGGSGQVVSGGNRTSHSGAGAAGTSYSGGSGGGACINQWATVSGDYYGGNGGANGGSGGYGYMNSGGTVLEKYNGRTYVAGGGAGNPGSNGASVTLSSSASTGNANDNTSKGSDGTGGLLIIYANKITNSGEISSCGSNGGNGREFPAGGGGSGGGSINIYYSDADSSIGTVNASGGAGGNGTGKGYITGSGGAGGNGSITETQVIF